MQLCNRIYYFKVYWRLNMFRAAHRSSSGALNCIFSLWFIYPCDDLPLSRLSGSYIVWSSWWWAVCRSKHVEPSINFGIINFITKLHLVGISTESSTMHGSMNIKSVEIIMLISVCGRLNQMYKDGALCVFICLWQMHFPSAVTCDNPTFSERSDSLTRFQVLTSVLMEN